MVIRGRGAGCSHPVKFDHELVSHGTTLQITTTHVCLCVIRFTLRVDCLVYLHRNYCGVLASSVPDQRVEGDVQSHDYRYLIAPLALLGGTPLRQLVLVSQTYFS